MAKPTSLKRDVIQPKPWDPCMVYFLLFPYIYHTNPNHTNAGKYTMHVHTLEIFGYILEFEPFEPWNPGLCNVNVRFTGRWSVRRTSALLLSCRFVGVLAAVGGVGGIDVFWDRKIFEKIDQQIDSPSKFSDWNVSTQQKSVRNAQKTSRICKSSMCRSTSNPDIFLPLTSIFTGWHGETPNPPQKKRIQMAFQKKGEDQFMNLIGSDWVNNVGLAARSLVNPNSTSKSLVLFCHIF